LYNEKRIPVVVKAIQEEAEGVKRFTLSPVDDAVLPRFSGGSHITTYIENDRIRIIRSYSLTNYGKEASGYDIAIRLHNASKGGSLYWHHQMKVGDRLWISYPKNYFPLSFKAKHHVFYAAGIGITPFLSMMAELKEKGASFELHYASKSKERCAFYAFLNTNYSEQCRFYFSEEGNRVSDTSLLQHYIGTHVYVCGPDSFLSQFADAARIIGYPDSSIHVERFAPIEPKEKTSFQVKLTSGAAVHVSKEQTLLDALLEAGIKVPYACRAGRCGTCELPVAEGEVDHYDSFLTEEQQRSQTVMLTCVSRAKGNGLVIDI
jgi:ferredoxin-NADP reductase